MSNNDGQFDFWLMVAFGGGLYSFFKGFRIYREYRVVEDTPEIPIRSIPMGLVHVHGRATGDERVSSPVTHTPCYYYKVDIERWKVHKNSGSWEHYKTDTDGVKFSLAEGSGRVLVDAQESELDLLKNRQCEIGGSASPRQEGATEVELRSYVNKVTVSKLAKWVGHKIEGSGPLSDPDKEQKRQAAIKLFSNPLGSPKFLEQMYSAQAPGVVEKLRQMGPQSDADKERMRVEAMEALKHPLGSPEFIEHMRQVAAREGNPDSLRKFEEGMEKMQRARQGGFEALVPPAEGRYRFTEYCVVPEHEYDVTGTCVENPSAKDEHDRNVIVKGKNEPTFLISYRTEKGIESTLRNRAVRYIFGGAGVSIACLAILLWRFGWF